MSQRRGETSLNLKICLGDFPNNRYAALREALGEEAKHLDCKSYERLLK